MRNRLLAVLALALMPIAAAAQDDLEGKIGLTMGYPAAVGVIWQASDRLALRPEFTVSRSSSELQTPGSTDTSGWIYGVGVSALFYLTNADNLRTYISPRYSYSRSTTTSTLTVLGTTTSNELTSSGSSVIGSFGAQYAIGPRFSAFGEVGFGYTGLTSRSAISGIRSTSRTWGTRTGAGFILYF